MRHLGRNSGFTLVELVIVLAISALTVTGILAGSGVLQRRTELTSSIDGIRLQLKGIQAEASQAVSLRASNKIGTSDDTVFGKLVEFENKANAITPGAERQMHVWTLVQSADRKSLYKCDGQVLSLPLQMSFINATNGANTDGWESVVFGRNPNQIYINPKFGSMAQPPSACNPPASPPPVTPAPPVACPPASQGNPLGSCPTTTPPPVPDACNIGAWQCGLYGQYYKNTTLAGSPNSAYIDYQVGAYLDAAGLSSSFPSFNSALTLRAKAPKNGVSVHWSGQILINDEPGDFPNPQTHTYCFGADQGSTATITIKGVVYSMTNTFGQLTASVGPHCWTVPAGVDPGWYDIDIKYNTQINGTAYADLTEQTGSSTQDVPDAYLRTSSSNMRIDPPNAFVSGLYGQYYSTVNYNNRVSTYTDPVIGDGGSQFSFDSANALSSGAIINADTFSDVLRYNTASTDSAQKSVKWTGQILVDTTGPQQYCDIADDNATIIIDGATLSTTAKPLVPPGNWVRVCGTTPSLTAGWHNLEVDYQNICCAGPPTNGGGANVRLETIKNGKYSEVAKNHLQRPLDWSANGSAGNCNAANTLCVHSNTGISGNIASTGTWGSSSTSPAGSCSNSNNYGQITYSKNNLTPDSSYNMDISYFNEPDSNYPVPSNYSYLVCVAVNGNLLNGGNPVSLPISDPGINPRTYTFSGISIPANGKVTVTLDWINDSWLPWTPFCFGNQSFCGYDANFGVSRLDLYRNLLPDGTLSKASTPPSSPIAVTPNPHATSTAQSLAANLRNLLAPAARAASSCDTNELNPQNYTVACFGAPQTSILNFQVPGQAGQGSIKLDTTDNSIEGGLIN